MTATPEVSHQEWSRFGRWKATAGLFFFCGLGLSIYAFAARPGVIDDSKLAFGVLATLLGLIIRGLSGAVSGRAKEIDLVIEEMRSGRREALAFDVKGKGCKHRPKKGIAIPLDPGYEIDLDELARLLAAVHDAAKESPTTRLTRVILWPPLQRALKRRPAYQELFGRGTGRRIGFNTSCEWFIHDEHVHLHFKS